MYVLSASGCAGKSALRPVSDESAVCTPSWLSEIQRIPDNVKTGAVSENIHFQNGAFAICRCAEFFLPQIKKRTKTRQIPFSCPNVFVHSCYSILQDHCHVNTLFQRFVYINFIYLLRTDFTGLQTRWRINSVPCIISYLRQCRRIFPAEAGGTDFLCSGHFRQMPHVQIGQ